MKYRKKLLAILIILIIGGFSALILLYRFGTQPNPSRQELCRKLESFIRVDECIQKESITDILTIAFEPSVTTRHQINEALGQYRVEIYSTPSGVREKYILATTWLDRNFPYRFQTTYDFRYDENDLFVRFQVKD